jgi:hypothetical protein
LPRLRSNISNVSIRPGIAKPGSFCVLRSRFGSDRDVLVYLMRWLNRRPPLPAALVDRVGYRPPLGLTLHPWGIDAMDNDTNGLAELDEDILTFDVPDDALERAAPVTDRRLVITLFCTRDALSCGWPL